MVSSLENHDREQEIIEGLRAGGSQRRVYEEQLYDLFLYLIDEGVRKYRLTGEESASAYHDAFMSVIDNIVHNRFEGRSSLKSYTYQIFSNKCVDLKRKETTNKSKVHHTYDIEPLIMMLPDNARNIIQQMVDNSNRSVLRQCLQEIGEKCKQLLLLFEDGYSDREIAVSLEYNSADVVKVSRRRCMERLREKMHAIKRLYE
jgi:RNA polymerase sigma factor (sigma-70 family)